MLDRLVSVIICGLAVIALGFAGFDSHFISQKLFYLLAGFGIGYIGFGFGLTYGIEMTRELYLKEIRAYIRRRNNEK